AKNKSRKQPKGASMRQSLEFFKAGKTVEDIATLRELKESTILGHLLTFIPTGEIQIEQLFEQEVIDALIPVIHKNPDARSSEIRELTDEKYSYPEIQAVQALMRKENCRQTAT